MHAQLEALHEVLLMGPGPSTVPPSIYRALAQPTIGHLDPAFISIMDTLKEQLKELMVTNNALTLPMSGTGSAGMETCFANLVEPGDRVLILANGVFGKRMQDVATRLGAEVDVLDFAWGTPVVVEDVAARLQEHPYALVGVVHAETSTGVGNPVEAIGPLVRENGALFLVDAVTSLAGMPVPVDAWGIDALYSGTQKCLSCPPGLSPVSFSERAVNKLQARAGQVPNWYLDLTQIVNYWSGEKRSYHHTAPINMLYGLCEALALVLDEGKDAVYARHRAAHAQLAAGLQELGLTFLVEEASRLPMLNAVEIPEGVDEAALRAALLNRHRIEIGAGLGPLAGKVWRVGLMGHTARPEYVERLLTALKAEL